MLEFIIAYWVYAPTVVTIASIIAKVTPNEVDNKFALILSKIVDVFAFSSKPTELKKGLDAK
jgi:hypothetical protein